MPSGRAKRQLDSTSFEFFLDRGLGRDDVAEMLRFHGQVAHVMADVYPYGADSAPGRGGKLGAEFAGEECDDFWLNWPGLADLFDQVGRPRHDGAVDPYRPEAETPARVREAQRSMDRDSAEPDRFEHGCDSVSLPVESLDELGLVSAVDVQPVLAGEEATDGTASTSTDVAPTRYTTR